MPNPGLYVHIPFCRSKCPYCAFYSVASHSLIPLWLGAFKKEVIYYRDRFGRFDSLYLGGGTPTQLEVRALASVMGQIFTHLDFAPDAEITIEANPCDLTQEKITGLRALGFNRINLGVQSFDDRALSFLGRVHTVREAENALESLRSCGFENIGVDLIYGFEGQSLRQWVNTLKRAIAFQPEHLSCYQLSIEMGTPFGRLKDKGLNKSVSEEDQCSYFLKTSQFLENQGYTHYEISSFARERIYYSRHNRKYWHHIPYLGLGPSAHSFCGSSRWWNVRSIRKYSKMLECGKRPIEGKENLSDEQLRLESIALGLRTKEGVDLKEIAHNLRSNEMLSGFCDSGFLRVKSGRVTPTKKGFLVADYLSSCFLD